MADKRLAEQNQRWLRDLRRRIADLQEYAVMETVACTRERPGVDWDGIEKQIDKVRAIVSYGKSDTPKPRE